MCLKPGYVCQVLGDPALQSTIIPKQHRPLLAALQTDGGDIPLEGVLHPLFERNRWPKITDQQHSSLLPALTIATLLLEEPSLSPWWEQTLGGEREYDHQRRNYYLLPITKGCHDTAQEDVKHVLRDVLPKELSFNFHPLKSAEGIPLDGMAFGRIENFDCFRDSYQTYANPVCEPWIVLHSHFLHDLENLKSPHDLQHVHLRLAITLCHELAHIAWKYRFRHDSPGEPQHAKDEEGVELGHSWEQFVFGGSIWTMDSCHVYMYYRPASQTPSRIMVDRWWTSIFFRKSTWTNFAELHRRNELRLPTEAESGNMFRQLAIEDCDVWTYHKGCVDQDSYCEMPVTNTLYNRAMRLRQLDAMDESQRRQREKEAEKQRQHREAEVERQRHELDEECRRQVLGNFEDSKYSATEIGDTVPHLFTEKNRGATAPLNPVLLSD